MALIKISRVLFSLLLSSMFALIPISCSKPGDLIIENLNNNYVMVLGHGGMGSFYHYPNNSKISIETVIGIGADGSEVDVQMTKDSVLVLFHDIDLSEKTNGKGNVRDYSWNELSKLRYNYTDIQIYSLDQLFADYQHRSDIYFSLDIKFDESYYSDSLVKVLIRSLINTIDKYDYENRVFIEGDVSLLTKARELGLKSKLFVTASTFDNLLASSNLHDFFGIAMGANYVTSEQIMKSHADGRYFMMWSVVSNMITEAELKKGPDIIQADKPIYALMLLERFNYSYRIP